MIDALMILLIYYKNLCFIFSTANLSFCMILFEYICIKYIKTYAIKNIPRMHCSWSFGNWCFALPLATILCGSPGICLCCSWTAGHPYLLFLCLHSLIAPLLDSLCCHFAPIFLLHFPSSHFFLLLVLILFQLMFWGLLVFCSLLILT